MRRIEERTNVSYSGKWKQVQKYADYIPSPLENLKQNLGLSSKILLLDAKYVKIRNKSVCIHIAYDTFLGVIDYWIDDTENKTAYSYLLRRLRDVGYYPICAVTDGHGAFVSLMRELNIPHQLCLFHLLQTLKRLLNKNNGLFVEIPTNCLVLYSRIKGVLKTNNLENLGERIDQFRKIQYCWKTKKQKRILKWFWNIIVSGTITLSFEENIPRTTNKLENLNGQIEQRLKTFRGVKSENSLNKILKILFYFRKYK